MDDTGFEADPHGQSVNAFALAAEVAAPPTGPPAGSGGLRAVGGVVRDDRESHDHAAGEPSSQ